MVSDGQGLRELGRGEVNEQPCISHGIWKSVVQVHIKLDRHTENGKALIYTVLHQMWYQILEILSLGRGRQKHQVQGHPLPPKEVEANLGYRQTQQQQEPSKVKQNTKTTTINSCQIIDKCEGEHEARKGPYKQAVPTEAQEVGKWWKPSHSVAMFVFLLL